MVEKLKADLQSTDQVRFFWVLEKVPVQVPDGCILCLGWLRVNPLSCPGEGGLGPWDVWQVVDLSQFPPAFLPFNPAKGIHLSSGNTTGNSLEDSQL